MTVIPAIENGTNIFEGKLRDLASPDDFLVSILIFGTSWIPPHSVRKSCRVTVFQRLGGRFVERARKEEQRQQALDAEEAKLQQQARIDTLKHADSLLLEQTEKIRNFRSQQLLVETLNERDDQIKQKEEFSKKENDEEKLWRRVVMDDIKNSEQKRKVELARERQKSLELAKDLDMQRREREEQLKVELARERQKSLELAKDLEMQRREREELKEYLERNSNTLGDLFGSGCHPL